MAKYQGTNTAKNNPSLNKEQILLCVKKLDFITRLIGAQQCSAFHHFLLLDWSSHFQQVEQSLARDKNNSAIDLSCIDNLEVFKKVLSTTLQDNLSLLDLPFVQWLQIDKSIEQLNSWANCHLCHSYQIITTSKITIDFELSISREMIKSLKSQPYIKVSKSVKGVRAELQYREESSYFFRQIDAFLRQQANGGDINLYLVEGSEEVFEALKDSRRELSQDKRKISFDCESLSNAKDKLLESYLCAQKQWLEQSAIEENSLNQALDDIQAQLSKEKEKFYQEGGKRFNLIKHFIEDDSALIETDIPQRPLILDDKNIDVLMIAEVNEIEAKCYQEKIKRLKLSEDIKQKKHELNAVKVEIQKTQNPSEDIITSLKSLFENIAIDYCQREDSHTLYQSLKKASQSCERHLTALEVFDLVKEIDHASCYQLGELVSIEIRVKLHEFLRQNFSSELLTSNEGRSRNNSSFDSLLNRLLFIESKCFAELSLKQLLFDKVSFIDRIRQEMQLLIKQATNNLSASTWNRLVHALIKHGGILSAYLLVNDESSVFSKVQKEKYLQRMSYCKDLAFIQKVLDLSSNVYRSELEKSVHIEINGHPLVLSYKNEVLLLSMDNLHYLKDSSGKKKKLINFVSSKCGGSEGKDLEKIIQESSSENQAIEEAFKIFTDNLFNELGEGYLLDFIKELYNLKKQHIQRHRYIYRYLDMDAATDKNSTQLDIYNRFKIDTKDSMSHLSEIIDSDNNEITLTKSFTTKYQLTSNTITAHDLSRYKAAFLNKVIWLLLDISNKDLLGQRQSLYQVCMGSKKETLFINMMHHIGVDFDKYQCAEIDALNQLIDRLVRKNIDIIKCKLSEVGFQPLIKYLEENIVSVCSLWQMSQLENFVRVSLKHINECHSPQRLFECLSDLIGVRGEDDLLQLKNIAEGISYASLAKRLFSPDLENLLPDSKLNTMAFPEAKKRVADINKKFIEDTKEQFVKSLKDLDICFDNQALIPWVEHKGHGYEFTSDVGDNYDLLFTNESSSILINSVEDVLTVDLYLQSLSDKSKGYLVNCYRHKESHCIDYVRRYQQSSKQHGISESAIDESRFALSLIACFRFWMMDVFESQASYQHIDNITVNLAQDFMSQLREILFHDKSIKNDIITFLQQRIIFYVINHHSDISPHEMLNRLKSYLYQVKNQYDNVRQITVSTTNNNSAIGSLYQQHESQSIHTLYYQQAKKHYDVLSVSSIDSVSTFNWKDKKINSELYNNYRKVTSELSNNKSSNQLLLTLYYKPKGEGKVDVGGRYEYRSDIVIRSLQLACDDAEIEHAEVNLAFGYSQDDNQWQGLQNYIHSLSEKIHHLFSYVSPLVNKSQFNQLLALYYKLHLLKNALDFDNQKGIISIDRVADGKLVKLIASFLEINHLAQTLDKELPYYLKTNFSISLHFVNINGGICTLKRDFFKFLSDYLCQQYPDFLGEVEKEKCLFDVESTASFVLPQHRSLVNSPHYHQKYIDAGNHQSIELRTFKIPSQKLIDNCNNYHSVSYLNRKSSLSCLYDSSQSLLANVSHYLAIRLSIEDSQLYFKQYSQRDLIYRFIEHEQMMLDDLRRLDMFDDSYDGMLANTLRNINEALLNYLAWFNYKLPALHYYHETATPLMTSFPLLTKSSLKESQPITYLLSSADKALYNKELALAYIEHFQKQEPSFSKEVLSALKNHIRHYGCRLSVILEGIDSSQYNFDKALESKSDSPNSINDLMSLLLKLVVPDLSVLQDKSLDEQHIDLFESEWGHREINQLADIALLSPQKKLGASLVKVIRKKFLDRVNQISFYCRHFDYHQQSILFEKVISCQKRQIIDNLSGVRFSTQGRVIIDSLNDKKLYLRANFDSDIALVTSISVHHSDFLSACYQDYFGKELSAILFNEKVLPIQERLELKLKKIIQICKQVYVRGIGESLVFDESDWSAVLAASYQLCNKQWRDELRDFIKDAEETVTVEIINDWIVSYVLQSHRMIIHAVFQAIRVMDADAGHYHYINAIEAIRQNIMEADFKCITNDPYQLIDCDRATESFLVIKEKASALICQYYHYYPFYGECFLNNYTIRRLHCFDKEDDGYYSYDSLEWLLKTFNDRTTNFTEGIVLNYYLPIFKKDIQSGVFKEKHTIDVNDFLEPIFRFNSSQVRKGNLSQLFFFGIMVDGFDERDISRDLQGGALEELVLMQKITALYVIRQYSFLFDNQKELDELYIKVLRLYILYLKGYKDKSSGCLHLSSYGGQISSCINQFIKIHLDSVNTIQSRGMQSLFAHLVYQIFLENRAPNKHRLMVLQLAICFLQPALSLKSVDSLPSMMHFWGRVKMLISFSYRFSALSQNEKELLNAVFAKISDKKVTYASLIDVIDKVYKGSYQQNTGRILARYFNTSFVSTANKNTVSSLGLLSFGSFDNFMTDLMSVEPTTLPEVNEGAINLQHHYRVMNYQGLSNINLLSLCLSHAIKVYSLSVFSNGYQRVEWCELYADLFQETSNILDLSFDCKSMSMLLLSIKEQSIIQPALFEVTTSFIAEYFLDNSDAYSNHQLIDEYIGKNLQTIFEKLGLQAVVQALDESISEWSVNAPLCHLMLYEREGGYVLSEEKSDFNDESALDEKHYLYASYQQLLKGSIGFQAFNTLLKDYTLHCYQQLHQDFSTLKQSLIVREKIYFDDSEAKKLFHDQQVSREEISFKKRHKFEVKHKKEQDLYKQLQSDSAGRYKLRKSFESLFGVSLLFDETIYTQLLNAKLIEKVVKIEKKLSTLFFVVDPLKFTRECSCMQVATKFLDKKLSDARDKINELYDVYIPGTKLYESVSEHEEIVFKIEEELQSYEKVHDYLEQVVDRCKVTLKEAFHNKESGQLIAMRQYSVAQIPEHQSIEPHLLEVSFNEEVFREIDKLSSENIICHQFLSSSDKVIRLYEGSNRSFFYLSESYAYSDSEIFEAVFLLMTRLLINLDKKPLEELVLNFQASDDKFAMVVWSAYYLYQYGIKLKPIKLMVNGKHFAPKVPLVGHPPMVKSMLSYFGPRRVKRSLKVVEHIFKIKEKISGSKSLYKIYDALNKKKDL